MPLAAARRFARRVFSTGSGRSLRLHEAAGGRLGARRLWEGLETLEPRQLLTADLSQTLNVSLPSSTLFPTQSVLVSFNERNSGTTAANNFAVRTVLSANNVYGDGDDIQLGVYTETTQLNPGQTRRSPIQTYQIPSGTAAGQYFILSQIDSGGAVTESNESNNNAATSTALVRVALPSVSVRLADSRASENAGDTGRWTFQRTGPLTQALTVNFSLSGTATSGDDFAALGSSITFAAGSSTATLTLSPVNDTTPEDAETVTLALQAGAGFVTNSAAASATIQIADNEPTVSLIAADSVGGEQGSNTVAFRFTRTGPLTQALTVDYTLGGSATAGSDYAAPTGQITFAAGASTATLTVSPTDDSVAEGNETIVVTLVPASTPTYRLSATQNTATATIADNEPTVSIVAVDASASETAGNGAQFRVTRTGVSLASPLTVNLVLGGSATSGDDFAALPTSVTFTAGQSSVLINLTPVDDALAENPESVSLTLAANAAYTVSPTQGTASATIADNEPTISVSLLDATATEGATDTARVRFTRAGGNLAATLTVTYTLGGTASAGDYSGLTGSVTFAAGSSTADVTITAVDDPTAEQPENVTITLDPSTAYRLASGGAVTINIADNENSVGVELADSIVGESSGNTGMFRFTRTGPVANALSINLLVTGSATTGSDYTALPATVTFAAGSSTATLSVVGLDDSVAESAETVILTIAPDAGYSIVPARSTATVTLEDNEPTISVSVLDSVASESTGDTARVVFSRSGGSLADAVTVNYTVMGEASPGDYTGLTGSVVIPAGQSSATVTITGVDDTEVEGDEQLTIVLSSSGSFRLSGTSNSATVTLRDNEATVSVVASDVIGNETGPNNVAFRLSRTGPTTSALTVAYSMQGTATNGLDYQTLSGTVTFAAGSATATVTVLVINDNLAEGDETVTMVLTGAPNYEVSSTQAAATATIGDNEPVVFVSGLTSTPAAEGTTATTSFTIHRASASTAAPLTVTFTLGGTASSDGSDYTLSANGGVGGSGATRTVTIPVGNPSIEVTVTAVTDLLDEGTETIIVTPVGASNYRIAPTQNTVTLNVSDVIARDLTITDATVDAASFSNGGSGQAVTGSLALANNGSVAAGAFTVELRLSLDEVFGNSDDIVLGSVNVASLSAGASTNLAISQSVQGVLPAATGVYRLVARIDAGAAVSEAFEDNNILFAPSANLTIAA